MKDMPYVIKGKLHYRHANINKALCGTKSADFTNDAIKFLDAGKQRCLQCLNIARKIYNPNA